MVKEVWCRCIACAQFGEVLPDPWTGEPIEGQWVSAKVAAQHAKQDQYTSIVTTTLRNRRGTSSDLPVRARDVEEAESLEETQEACPKQDEKEGGGTVQVDVQVDVQGDNSLPAPVSGPDSPAPPRPPPQRHVSEREIASIFSEADKRQHKLFNYDLQLVFDVTPEYVEQPAPFPLYNLSEDNQVFVNHYQWIQATIRRVNAMTVPDELVNLQVGLLKKLFQDKDTLDDFVSLNWTKHIHRNIGQSFSVAYPHVSVSVNPPNYSSLPRQPFVLVALLLVVLLETLAGLSRPYGVALLSTFQVALCGAFRFCNRSPQGSLTREQELALQDLPMDGRTARQRLQLDPEHIPFVCCPACFHLYPPDSAPSHCTRKDLKKVCGEELFKAATTDGVEPDDDLKVRNSKRSKKKGSKAKKVKTKPSDRTPRKVFGFQTIQSWLGRFLNRPGIEEFLDAAWDQPPSEGDMWGATAIRTFRGPDGNLFSIRPPKTYHLLFSLFIDWFNPYGNKQAGRSYSTGVMYMVCLNLPPHLRYRLENVYLVGVIPGPKEPSLHQMNHVLQPLVDTFLQFWSTGFAASRTYLHPEGMMIRGAILPLICDLPAARKAVGFVSYAANLFCSFCSLTKGEMDNFFPETWPRKHTYATHLQYAIQWRDATTGAARKAIEDTFGIRWSELLRLPYWNPLEYSILDAMHNLFLGEFQHHCRRVWNMNIKDATGKKKELPPHSASKQQEEYDKLVKGIISGSESALSRLRKGYVVALATVNGVKVKFGSAHRLYSRALLDWYQTAEVKPDIIVPPIAVTETVATEEDDDQDMEDRDGDRDGDDAVPTKGKEANLEPLPQSGYISKEVIEAIQQDIATTTLPSWLERPPTNFGSPSHGKLKADHWRTVCTVNLVITLTRLWGNLPDQDAHHRMLKNFLDLVIAVEHASKRSMNESRIIIYETHMRRYLQTLASIYPVPNHHLSLHLPQCFRNFGPVHAWWSFPFERYNGVMQRLRKNHKPSQMEMTFLRAFARGSNLRALIPQLKLPDLADYHNLIKRFINTFLSTSQGTLISDILSFNFSSSQPQSTTGDSQDGISGKAMMANGSRFVMDHGKCLLLPQAFYAKLLQRLDLQCGGRFVHHESMYDDKLPLPREAQRLRKIRIGGETYNTSRSSRAPGNSFIIFRLPGDGIQHAGRIQDIYLHRRRHDDDIVLEPFVFVQEYKHLAGEDCQHDLYSKVPNLGAWLCYDEFLPDGHVLSTHDIITHFASYSYVPPGIDKACIVVKSLDRN